MAMSAGDKAQIAAAVIASCALLFTGAQVYYARQVGAFQALNEFLRTFRERETAIGLTENKTAAVNDLLNTLEAYCLAFDSWMIFGKTRTLVRETLAKTIVFLEANDESRAMIKAAIDSSDAFANITEFYGKNKTLIARYAAEARLLEKAADEAT